MMGSVGSSVFPSPMTPPYMSPWQTTPNPYMPMSPMMNEHELSPLMASMAGLGISHMMTSPIPTGPHIPSDLHTHESRGTTYFTRKGQEAYNISYNNLQSVPEGNRFEPQSSISSSHRAEDSLGQSSHASILSPIHSREASVETSATSNQAGSLDIKTVEDSGSDGRAGGEGDEASPLGVSISSTCSSSSTRGTGDQGNEEQQGLTVNDNFGERGRAATSEAVLRSPRLPQPGKKGFMVSCCRPRLSMFALDEIRS